MFLRLLALTVNPVLAHPLARPDPDHAFLDVVPVASENRHPLRQAQAVEQSEGDERGQMVASPKRGQNPAFLRIPCRLDRRPQRGDRGLRGAAGQRGQPGRSCGLLAGATGGGIRACTGGGVRPAWTDVPADGPAFGHAGHLSRISLRLASGSFPARSFARSKSLAFTASSAMANRLSESGLPTLRSAISRV